MARNLLKLSLKFRQPPSRLGLLSAIAFVCIGWFVLFSSIFSSIFPESAKYPAMPRDGKIVSRSDYPSKELPTFAESVTMHLYDVDEETYESFTESLTAGDLAPHLVEKLKAQGLIPDSETKLEANLKAMARSRSTAPAVKFIKASQMGFSKADFPRVKVNFDFEFNNNGVKKVIRNGIVYTIGFWRDSGRPVVIDMISTTLEAKN
ncbi:MAG: hypothetical protein KC652_13155 [Cyanobacteria bacterium HKST-UBA01]|nr:hypothetical protein [Cyanobacteria bacterium HKST-UBA01]